MIRFYLFRSLVILIVVPQNAHSIFLAPLATIISATGSLTCNSGSTPTSTDYRLCAIRVYTTNNNQASSTVNVYDGMWYANTFRPLIKTRSCTGFTATSDIGFGKCSLMPYENADAMTLCICATSGCNANLTTCQQSVQTNPISSALPAIISNLTTMMTCYDTTNSSSTCSNAQTTSFVNNTACQIYVKSHSVLCGIVIEPTGTITQVGSIEENYQSFLTSGIHEIASWGVGLPNEYNDTTISTYLKYAFGTITYVACECAENSFCNNNISTCASNVKQTQTTTVTEYSSSFFTDMTSKFTLTTATTSSVSTTATTTRSTVTTIATSTTTATTTASTVATSSTTAGLTVSKDSSTQRSTIAIASTTAESTFATESMTTESTAVTASMTVESTIATAFVNITETTESTAITSMATITSSGAANVVPNDTGISRGAIAGIVVGTTLAAVIFVSFVSFALVKSGIFTCPADRTASYRL